MRIKLFIVMHVLIISSLFDAKDSRFSTNTVMHENGDRTVTYEHSGNNENWDYSFKASFEHERHDTLERVSCSNISYGITHTERQEEERDQSSQSHEDSLPDHEVEQKNSCNSDCQSHTSRNDFNYHDYYDQAHERNLDNYFDRITDGKNDTYSKVSSRGQRYTDDYKYENQRSSIYLICKQIKEDLIGKSEKTKQQERAQNIARQQADQQRKQEQEIVKAAQFKCKKAFADELELAYAQYQESLQQSDNQEFLRIMQGRNDSFHLSLQNQTPVTKKYQLTASTIGFLQAHNIDHRHFLQFSGLPIQHQLTYELIANLNNFAHIANANFGNQRIFPLIQSGALVCGMAQNYNQAHQLLNAISATNSSHGFLYYLQGMVSSGMDRCSQLATALSFFSCEVAKYTFAGARGVAHGIVASEVTTIGVTGLGNIAARIAPELTASVYAGATSIMVPVAVTAAGVCSGVLLAELGHLGYLYSTSQFNQVTIELDRIKKFAEQFYNFDQAPIDHVENLAMLSTTLVWPSQRQAIFESLIGMQKVTCTMWLDAQNFVSQTRVATHNEIANVLDYIKNHELFQFDISYKKIFGQHLIDIFPIKNPGLVPAGVQGLMNPCDQKKLVQLFLAQESSVGGNALKAGLSQGIAGYITEFLSTDVGKKMQLLAQQKYEKGRLSRITKEYSKIIAHGAPQGIVDTFLRCHELSMIPAEVSKNLESLHEIFKDAYLGLPEFSSKNKYLTMHVKHIFYPSLEPEFDENYQEIIEFILNGFHHDEYAVLEKSGLFTYANKIYGNAVFGAEECF